MRAVVARVHSASVTVERADGTAEVVGEIGTGLLVLLGVHRDDTADAVDTTRRVDTMARKLHELRLLRDERSCAETGDPLLLVSQFTLYGETRKGRRPTWAAAAGPAEAAQVVDAVITRLRECGATVRTGEFGATMAVESVNDGPFTVLVEV